MELAGWDTTEFRHGERNRTVFRRGIGPAILLIHEVPGITPGVLALGEELAGAGFAVAVPQLFGTPGAARTRWREVSALAQVVTSRQFTPLRTRRTSPIAGWLRALAGALHIEAGGAGVGVVGVCLGGSVASAVAADPSVRAVVVSEPCAPLAVSPAQRRDLNLAPSDLAIVAQRARVGQLAVLGFRFSRDRFVPGTRFDAYRRVFGSRFEPVEILDSSRSGRCPHSVLTFDPARHAAQPAELEQLVHARTRVRTFLKERLSA